MYARMLVCIYARLFVCLFVCLVSCKYFIMYNVQDVQTYWIRTLPCHSHRTRMHTCIHTLTIVRWKNLALSLGNTRICPAGKYPLRWKAIDSHTSCHRGLWVPRWVFNVLFAGF